MIFGYRGIEPQTITDDISLRDRLQGLGGTNQHIATHHHRVDSLWRQSHHLLVKRQLQTQQILRESLASFPTKHWNRHEHLTRNGITGQALALTTCVNEDALLAREPSIQVRLALSTTSLLEQPCGSSTTTEAMTYRVASTEIVLPTETRHLMKLAYHVWRQRQ